MNILRTLANLFAYPDPWEAATRNQIAKDARQKRAHGDKPIHLNADDMMDDPYPASLISTPFHERPYAGKAKRDHG